MKSFLQRVKQSNIKLIITVRFFGWIFRSSSNDFINVKMHYKRLLSKRVQLKDM